MKTSMKWIRFAAAGALLSLGLVGQADARVFVNVGIGLAAPVVGYAPVPVYAPPPPVYYAPPPVYVAPPVYAPRPVYVAPPPIVYGPPRGWYRY